MGALTTFLQLEFARLSPSGWSCRREVALLSPELAGLLGYAPRADVLLEHGDSRQRLWIEFEVSRADPVANHAKFATSHLFQPQPETDAFVAMVSSDVARGRRNLSANMVLLMRRLGMSAFQTVLFPLMSASEVRRLNQMDWEGLHREHPVVEPEIERALAVSRPVLAMPGRRIHFAGDMLEVMMNLRQWNEAIGTAEGAALWGRRAVTYFVHDPRSRSFAPSKFCAYIPVVSAACSDGEGSPTSLRPLMTMKLYSSLDHTVGPFDGNQAWNHLTRRLGMIARSPSEAPDVAAAFTAWVGHQGGKLSLHPSAPVFLLAPGWFK